MLSYKVENIRRFEGYTSKFLKAKVWFMNRKFDVSYDFNTGRVKIVQWYFLEEDEYRFLRDELVEFFKRAEGGNEQEG